MSNCGPILVLFFPNCQVRVVRFNVSCLLLPRPPPPPPLLVLLVIFSSLSSSSNCHHAIHSVLCRTSTTTIHAPCSLPDLNHDKPRPATRAGPQPRQSTPSLSDLNRGYPRQVIPLGPHAGKYGTKNFQKKELSERNVRRYMPEDMPDGRPHNIPEDIPATRPKKLPENARRYVRIYARGLVK